MIMGTVQIVALLFGLIPVGDQTLPVFLEFKTISACNVARISLEAKYDGAKLSCLDGAVHMGSQRGLPYMESMP